MKKLNVKMLAQKVISLRKEKHLSQQQLSILTGINRAIISRLEQGNYIPLIPHLKNSVMFLDLSQVLCLEMSLSCPLQLFIRQ